MIKEEIFNLFENYHSSVCLETKTTISSHLHQLASETKPDTASWSRQHKKQSETNLSEYVWI